MGTRKSLRESKKVRTRNDLMEAACALFEERGFENTNVDDIVERAHYSRSTFFRYFGTKEDVLFGDIPERTATFRLLLTQARAGEDPIHAARAIFEDQLADFVGFEELDPGLRRRVLTLWFEEPGLRRRYAEFFTEWENIVAEFLRSGPNGLTHMESEVIATALVGVGRAVVHAYATAGIELAIGMAQGFAALELGFAAMTARRRMVAGE